MIWLIRKLFWFALFLIATFSFVVLFEHGPNDFAKNARTEFAGIQKLWSTPLQKKKDESDKIGH